ncbi:MAG: CocE/NonD family hydrolase, partial [Myxococcota bacterium]|nr:CocE/NonD family hydrolase [Myxococcota bacterium]
MPDCPKNFLRRVGVNPARIRPRRLGLPGKPWALSIWAALCLALASVGCTVAYNEAQFQVIEGVGEIRISGAFPMAEVEVVDGRGAVVMSGATDSTGAWAGTLAPGQGYRVNVTSGSRREQTDPVDVFRLATFEVQESVEQLYITDARPGSTLEVRDDRGELMAEGPVDIRRAFIARALDPARNTYRVIDREALEASAEKSVLSVEGSLPDPSFYSNQVLTPGYNYITTRDGTTLSAYVTLPGPLKDEAGDFIEYPTLVSYSGYQPSKPGGPIGLPEDLEIFRDAICLSLPTVCDAPSHPAGMIGGLFGFATVGVNMRGTGCSGGAYDYFETLQVLDGYDLIETVAAQHWVLHNHVGMAGISYPGISQLFTARTRPPGLVAITPLSVIANTATSVLAPGGIFNDGFAFQWAEQVFNQAAPYGQGWEATQVSVEAAEGETTCADNQTLHLQAVDPIQRALETPYYISEIVDPLSPSSFAGEIDVPVFLTGAWQDEQTGPDFGTLLDDFSSAPVQRFTVFNGLHPDGYSPDTLAEWKAFNDLYVAERVPFDPPLYAVIAPLLFGEAFGGALPPSEIPFKAASLPAPGTLAQALAAFEAQPRVKVIFERGSNPERLGLPSDGFAMHFSDWPPAEATPWRLYLHADGSLAEASPSAAGESASKFEHDPEAGQRTLEGPQPHYYWPPCDDVAEPGCVADPPEGSGWAYPAAGKALVFETAPLAVDHVLAGSASVDLWMQSSATDADIEVLISEISPAGDEIYVQAGWLRVSQRALAPGASELRPEKTHLEADAAPLPPGQWEPVRVEVMSFAAAFRAGSRLRLEISTPGDNRELWRFALLEYPPDAQVEHQVAHSLAQPSSLVLPLIPASAYPGGTVPAAHPACNSSRGRPCRPWEGYGNVGV